MSEHDTLRTDAGEVQHRPRFRDLLLQLAIGLALVAVVLVVQDFGFFNTNTDDAAADKLMRFHAGVVDENRQANPFALIAIDEQTYGDWGEPLITPRDKLAKIIEFAINGEAKLIFLDIELSRLGDGTPVSGKPRTCSELRPPQNPDDQLCDRVLGQTGKCAQLRQLRDADADLCELISKTASVPIILARTIVARPDARPGEERWKIRPSFIPDDGVHWASPLYSLDSDRFIRRSRIWELVCENKHNEESSLAVPSVELLALALIRDKADALKEIMARMSGGDCGRPVNLAKARPLQLCTSDGRPFEINFAPKSPGDRILYTVGWSGEQSRLYADQQGQDRRPQVIIPETGVKADLVTTISARAIIEATDSAKPDRSVVKDHISVVKDHIVVIGATHREAGDLHETPLGLMPGSLIIINAIHSLREYGQLVEPPIWKKAVVATVIMIIFVLLYHYLWSTLAAVIVLLISFLLAFSLNVLFVRQGIWIDAALPSLIYWLLERIWSYFFTEGSWFRAGFRALRQACLRALRH